MLRFIRYQTPSKYLDEFDDHYSYINLKQVSIISSIVFALSLFLRLSFLLFNTEIVKFGFYKELSHVNLIQLTGSLTFFLLSSYLLRSKNTSLKLRNTTALIFVMYTLTISFAVSYVLTLHDTKNMLTMFLLGIIIVSLFFALDFKSIMIVVTYITVLYLTTLYLSDLATNQQNINYAAALILGVALLSFSRYGYYFKSQHFIKIKELEEKNQEILHLNTQKGEILSFVAHDLRAPLNNIEALSGLMLLEDENNNEAKIIVNASLQAKRIIDDLIDAAKQDRQMLATEVIVLNDFIKNLVVKWNTNSKREIRLVMAEEEVLMNASSSKLERAIDNLIGNALKFSKADQPIDIAVLKMGDNVTIKIIDYGIGIPEHLQAHVFKQFSVASRVGLKGEKSIGLGLHISHKIIEQHGGSLLLESIENEGTTFTIAIPLATA